MKNQEIPNTPRGIAEQKYATARSNLLLMLILTAVNILLLAFGSNTMLLFSATVPYLAVTIGYFSEITAIFIASICFAVVILIMYFLCWLLSKKHYGWMIAALVFFVIDTLAMISLYISAEDFSGILDFIIHIWVIYYLIIGVANGHKLKTLPDDPEFCSDIELTDETVYHNNEFDKQLNSVERRNDYPLRSADMSVKSRIFLETESKGHRICYRRVKRINELVIDGYVYDDVEMLLESAHSLNARIDGHVFQVGYDGAAHSYLRVDGEPVAKKLRLW